MKYIKLSVIGGKNQTPSDQKSSGPHGKMNWDLEVPETLQVSSTQIAEFASSLRQLL